MPDNDDKFTFTHEDTRPCRILPGQTRRDLAARPTGPVTTEDNQRMIESGFDKDLTLGAYFKQACENCRACIPARIVAHDYVFSRGEQRILNQNRDLTVRIATAPDASEHQPLFLRNFEDRHKDSYSLFQQMTIRHSFNVAALLQNPMVQNSVMEVRDAHGKLVGATVFDDAGNGLKLNYYYYEPGMPAGRSLGTFMILKCIEEARRTGKDYVYISALTEQPSKISYKARFRPLETLRGGNWTPYNPEP